MIDGFWISTVILLAMSIGVVYLRQTTSSNETNWPLVYYALVLLHMQLFPEGLSEKLVYTTTFIGLMIRFEFMSGWIQKVIFAAEQIGLLWIAYSLFKIIL